MLTAPQVSRELILRTPLKQPIVERRHVAPALHPRLANILDRLATVAPTNIGFPTAVDIDYRPLAPFLRYMINNVGGPEGDTTYPAHVKDLERDVLDWFAALFQAPPGWTGYLTSGGTEGTLHGLLNARDGCPEAIVYASTASHYSVKKACDLLGLPLVKIASDAHGRMDCERLRHELSRRGHQPAIVVATIGTTMTEAVDIVPDIRAAIEAARVQRSWIHADAALSGLPRALSGRHDFDLAGGCADSLSISGHKWWGAPIPCGAALIRRPPRRRGRRIDYIGCCDSTISGSRAGLAAVMLWHAITRHDVAGHRRRVERARDVASYALRKLTDIRWECWRNPDALTIMLKPLPDVLRDRWRLPIAGGWSHLICMPGVERQAVDALTSELSTSNESLLRMRGFVD
ncbi:histidine decarboxylase [Actinoplanes sp. LDG1-06]|uniref:Histidine decarboxylase n=1 Tax=Paractinoplanes ovalisporus TaxID=2810368 RepID=A0ABS2AU27_9ACTN|nr:histidine decarboxylase [Actinoplanes ovalisporus]MBM2623369.1 histidine decarboxylase [Actinoplanes ovalisporus]